MQTLLRDKNTQSALLPDGYVAIFHTQTKLSVVLPPLGGLVWEFCDGSHTLQQILDALTECAGAHGPLPSNLEEEVKTLVDTLCTDGFVHLRSSGG
jgi:hypothetical protein